MASDNETLYFVTKQSITLFKIPNPKPWLFRTRKAARDFAKAKNKKSRRFRYSVTPAKWGPGQ